MTNSRLINLVDTRDVSAPKRIWQKLCTFYILVKHWSCTLHDVFTSAFFCLWFDQVITVCGCGKDQNHSPPTECSNKREIFRENQALVKSFKQRPDDENLEILAEMVAADDEASSMHLHNSVGHSPLPERLNQTLMLGDSHAIQGCF